MIVKHNIPFIYLHTAMANRLDHLIKKHLLLQFTGYRQILAISTGSAMRGNYASQLSVIGYKTKTQTRPTNVAWVRVGWVEAIPPYEIWGTKLNQ
ncbi:MAG TPA: hypothetical protein EYP59_06730 [Thiotrichaceae bacterium]|nr:hypothetical protein [Thiotrichaceae bacterium]